MEQEEKEERIEQLEEAQNKIHEAIELIRSAVADTDNEHQAESYIIGHLQNWADGDNQYDRTAIPRLIENIESYEEEDDTEEALRILNEN